MIKNGTNSVSKDKKNLNINSTEKSIKFDKLSIGTLRRYQTFFKLTDKEFETKNKDQLLNLIKRHFYEMDLSLEKVLDRFSKIEKDQNSEKNNSIRKSLRFQEKNMTKFLDNISNIK